ncbi:MAG: response regulator transcription factor [Nitrospirae bacterium]|nr:response regulator transcription factor [Nitrospirota bacterium]
MKILVSLSNQLLCDALGMLLCGDEKFENLAARDFSAIDGFNPDIVLVDFLTLGRGASEAWPSAKIILIDNGIAEQTVYALIHYRLSGVISVDTTPELFSKAIRVVHEGQVWIDNTNIKAVLNHAGSITGGMKFEPVSAREQEIINLVARGTSNKNIAQALFISEQTVKAHLCRIFRKMNVTGRAQLAPFAVWNENATASPESS